MGLSALRRYHADSEAVGGDPVFNPAPLGRADEAREDAAAEVGRERELAAKDELAEVSKAFQAEPTVANAEALVEATKAVDEAIAADDEDRDTAAAVAAAEAEDARVALEQAREAGRVREHEAKLALAKVEADENSTPEDIAAEQAKVNEAIEQDEAERAASADADQSKHGDLDRPAKGASTDVWVAYAEADPQGHGLDLTPRPGLRDVVAKHYLGE